MVEDLTIKAITDVASDSYSDSSQLSLLSRKELSDVQKDSTQKLGQPIRTGKRKNIHLFNQKKLMIMMTMRDTTKQGNGFKKIEYI